MSEQSHPDLTCHVVQAKRGPLNLSRKPKWHETVIQALLLGCGLLSIFTTLGIILVLGNESIAFFTRDQWVNTNRAILNDMDVGATSVTVEEGKALEAIEAGSVIRIGQEVMEVVEFHHNRVEIDVLGTGGGFDRWCASDADLAKDKADRPHIVSASRAAKAEEIEVCADAGIWPIAFRVGTDALAITVSADNDFLSRVELPGIATDLRWGGDLVAGAGGMAGGADPTGHPGPEQRQF